jgi:two-component system sporulation sensor kinase B
MTTAKGFLQLIATSDFNDEKKREFAVIAISELDRADYIIKDFFTYSNSKPNSKEDIKLKDVIQETLIVLNPLANINSVQMFFYSNSDSLICGEVETWEGKPPGAAWRMYIIW